MFYSSSAISLEDLGAEKVCAIKRGDVEIPSDFADVVWETMDAGNGWKRALVLELQAAGHEVDWNKVMPMSDLVTRPPLISRFTTKPDRFS